MARPSPQTERVVRLIDLLAARPDEALTLSEISRRLRVNKATCHAMLATLTDAGWLLRHPTRKTYQLGPALVAVGRAVAIDLPALEFARPIIERLSDELGMACLAVAPSGEHLTVVDEVGPPSLVRVFRVGEQIPIRPPFGAGFVAWSDAATRARWLDQVDSDAAGRRFCDDALETSRRRGFAVELVTEPEARLRELVADFGADAGRMRELLEDLAREPLDGERFLAAQLDRTKRYRVSTIGSPVFDPDLRVVLVLVAVSPGGLIPGEQVHTIGQRVADAARRLTNALGG